MALRSVLLVGVAGYLVTLLPTLRAGQTYVPLIDAWMTLGLSTAIAVLVIRHGILSWPQRSAWVWIGAGLLAYDLGDLYYYAFLVRREVEPVPSLADAGWLISYLLMAFGMIRLLRARVGTVPIGVVLDALVVGLGGAAVAGALIFEPVLRVADGDFAAVATNIAYPVADLILLALLLGIFNIYAWRPDRSWWLLLAGASLLVVTDIVWLSELASNSYVDGGLVDGGWVIARTALGFAAWSRTPSTPDLPRANRSPTLKALPVSFFLGSVMVLFFAAIGGAPYGAVCFAAACVLVAATRLIVSSRDAVRLAEEVHEARPDGLTGLPNRRAFFVRLTDLLEGRAPSEPMAILLADVDRFKHVNDSLGHDIGDEVLCEIGSRWKAALGNRGYLARLGGDEFGVLIEESALLAQSPTGWLEDPAGTAISGERRADIENDGADRAMRLARYLAQTLDAPLWVHDHRLHLGMSIGVAVWPKHGHDPLELLRRADQAMYQAKRERTVVELAEGAAHDPALDRLALVEALHSTLEAGEITVHYQPKVDLRTGTVASLEALVRWDHPQLGLLAPDTFLPLAEEAGLLPMLGRAVLARALADISNWREYTATVPVAINLSRSELLDPLLPAQVSAALHARQLPCHAIEFEVTERGAVGLSDPSFATLTELKELGFRVALDDYGTGYSSLTRLRQLPIDELKIDREFVTHVTEDPTSDAIVSSTIQLAHSLGLVVTAEGVEDQACVEHLVERGCDLAQGYHLGVPAPADEFGCWLPGRPPVKSNA